VGIATIDGKDVSLSIKNSKEGFIVSLFDLVRKNVSSAQRIAHTSFVVQKNSFRWLLNRKPIPEVLCSTMVELGTTYIKLGQLIASSPSIFPHEYVEAFQNCLDQTPTVPYEIIEKILRDELGEKINDFAKIEQTPLASASIAQVHVAQLKTGENVVIKVQKPGVQRIVETDCHFLQFSASVIELLNPALARSSITDIVAEIRNGMLKECDFLQEAENIREYHEFLVATDNQLVVVPKVYSDYSTTQVLTMERFYGVSLVDLDAVKRYIDDPEEALIGALNTWFASIQQCQIYHADLHAGNVMALIDGRIGFIDFGIVGKISDKVWKALVSLTICLPLQDYLQIAQALVDIGMTDQEVDVPAFARDIESMVKEFNGTTRSYESDEQFLRNITLKISSVGRKNGVRFPREFVLLIKQFLYFDRYISLLAPDLEMFNDERVALVFNNEFHEEF